MALQPKEYAEKFLPESLHEEFYRGMEQWHGSSDFHDFHYSLDVYQIICLPKSENIDTYLIFKNHIETIINRNKNEELVELINYMSDFITRINFK